MGRKGKLTTLLRSVSELSIEDKKTIGKFINDYKVEFTALILQKKTLLKNVSLEQKLSQEIFDTTLPGTIFPRGHQHPLSQVIAELVRIFHSFGFVVADGPEMESEFYNFEALNIPPNHPARDMQDTFYIEQTGKQPSLPSLGHLTSHEDPSLLRTHTSPVQVRIMQKYPPPISIIVPGRVYRHEAMDATHSCMFHQVEGLLVDKNVSFADLKGTLTRFAQLFFEKDVKTRFRPSYFPFTEPSAEMDISCLICSGTGCRVCKQTGWVELLGSGMVNPKVFEEVRLDPDQYSGFAFGIGIERLAIFKYGVDDLRLFCENDLRFLKQF